MELELEHAQRECLKCRYVRQGTDVAPDYSCPNCGAVYAKLEAARDASVAAHQLAEEEARITAIRMQQSERADAETRERQTQESPLRSMAHAVYLLYVLPFAITQVSGLLLAYRFHRPAGDSWINDHFTWQIRTFWYLIFPALIGLAALLVGGAATTAFVATRGERFLATALGSLKVVGAVAAFIVVLYLFRVGRGWYKLFRQESPW